MDTTARFRKPYESEENGYRINADGAKPLILWSIPLLRMDMVTLFLPLKGNAR